MIAHTNTEDESAKPKGESTLELPIRSAHNLEARRQAYFEDTVWSLLSYV